MEFRAQSRKNRTITIALYIEFLIFCFTDFPSQKSILFLINRFLISTYNLRILFKLNLCDTKSISTHEQCQHYSNLRFDFSNYSFNVHIYL